jgi:hypothetical protein
MTNTQNPHPSTEPFGKPGDTREIRDGNHILHQLRLSSGWMITSIEIRPR